MKSIALKTFLLLSIVLLQGCMPDSLTKFKEETKPQKTSAGATTPDNPPGSVSYSPSSFKFIKNNPIVSVLPVVTGDVESYSITPTLPAGLAFETTTGRIYGTPTTFSAENTYVITATNSIGSITTNIKISVFSQPTGLRYTSTPKVKITLSDSSAFTVGSTISVEPLNGATLSGTVSQVLGNILEVTVNSASMGTPFSPVMGISRMVDDAATYVAGVATITDVDYTSKVQLTMLPTSAVASFSINSPVSNSTAAYGQVLDLSSSTILVGVLSGSFSTNDLLDDATTYAASVGSASAINYVYSPGDSIDLRPVLTDGESITYSISPDLPEDFTTFNEVNGIIQGTQSGTTSLSLTVTAENPVGSVATSLSIGPFIAPPENLSISNELLITLNNNSKFYRGRPVSSDTDGKGIVLKRFGDGKTILISHTEGTFVKDGSIDDALTFGGEEAVIQKTETANLRVRLASSAGYENNIGKVATSSTGGTGIITFVDSGNNEVYLKYLAGTFSDTSASTASTLTVAALTQNITRVLSTNIRITATTSIGGETIANRFDKGFHVTSNSLSAGLVHQIIGSTATADIVTGVASEGFVDGALLDNYSPYIQSEATVSRVAYEHAFYLYTTEKAVLTPNLPKGDNVTYSITPDLPPGLTLNTTSGLISGQPTEPSVLKSYVLTAKNITNGIQQSTTHTFKMRVYDDFGVFNTLSEANSVILHREGMGHNISTCRLTKDQLENGKNYARINLPTPHPFTVGSTISSQFGARGTVEQLIQDPNVSTTEAIIVRIQNGSFSASQNVDDVYPFVATAATISQVHRRSYNKDITCRLEVAENDLWTLGAKFNIRSGKGICDYIVHTPYSYYRYPAHATNNAIVIKEVDNSDGICGGGDFEYTGSVNELDTYKCAGDWSSSGGPNCDTGLYTARRITYSAIDTNSDGTPDTCIKDVDVQEVQCGGSQRACMSGGIREIVDPESASALQFVTGQGANLETTMNGPQKQSPIRATNIFLANYAANNSCAQSNGNPSEAIHSGKNYNYTVEHWKDYSRSTSTSYTTPLTVSGAVTNSAIVTTSADPTGYFKAGMAVNIGGTLYRIAAVSATTITLHNRVQSIPDTTAISIPFFNNDPIVGGSPFYEITCLDPGADVIGRIYLQIREWDRFFSPEDDVDVLTQKLVNGTVDMAASSTSVATTGAADLDVFTLLDNGNDQRLITIGSQNHTVDMLDNFSASAFDAMTTVTTASVAQTAMNAWIRPLKLDSGQGIDGFGNGYNNIKDWDDINGSAHPSYTGCMVTRPDPLFFTTETHYPYLYGSE